MASSQSPQALLEQACETQVFSAYQVVAEHAGKTEHWEGGATSYWPGAVKVDEGTFFDIGSVTKAVVTTSLCARAVGAKKLKLEESVDRYVKEWRNSALGSFTIRDLLCHASGARALLPLSRFPQAASGLRAFALAHSNEWIEASPGTQTVYSDLGFLMLGEVLQEVWETSLDKAFDSQVVQPLSLREVVYPPLPTGSAVAATEVREGVPVSGVVFDENSAHLGGRTAHAGLFATARGLAPWAREWLAAWHGKSRWLTQDIARSFTARAQRTHGSTWALGWDTKSATGSSAGTRFSAESFGHLGYPGCSVWIDATRGGYVVFLSNRVHPSRLDERIRKLRPVLHDAISGSW